MADMHMDPRYTAEEIRAYQRRKASEGNGHNETGKNSRAPLATIGDGPPVDSWSRSLSVDQFHAYMPMHKYVFVPTGEMWPAASVNASISPIWNGKDETISASEWLDKNRAVDQMTWAPGEPMLIRDRLVSNGGWTDQPGCTCFNQYRPPIVGVADPHNAGPWIKHVSKVFPDDAKHIIRWLAHRVQRPGEKINHALVLAGDSGIGKDTILEPVKYAIGPSNFNDISPSLLLGRFNGYAKSVILRINEARDLGELNRYAFYEHTKTYIAAPPDVIRVDEKNVREYTIFNVCGVILTSNHKVGGIYLPADDRRHYVAWSSCTRDDFSEDYWLDFYKWLQDGGNAAVAAYLANYDLTGFDPKAPPPKTAAFWDIVDAGRAPEDAELADAIDAIHNPNAFTLPDIKPAVSKEFWEFLSDRRNRRQIPHRIEAVGYTAIHNSAAKDGLWKVRGKRQAIYAKSELSERDRFAAATEIAKP